jgi:acyl-CoA thioesterase
MNDLNTAQRCADTMLANDKSSAAMGIAVEVLEPGKVIASMTVREDMLNGFDVIHGGLTFTLADTAFAFACNSYNQLAFAASAHIEFLRPAVVHDELTACTTEDHRGRRSGYYTVEVRNQRKELVALFRGRSVSTGESVISD